MFQGLQSIKIVKYFVIFDMYIIFYNLAKKNVFLFCIKNIK